MPPSGDLGFPRFPVPLEEPGEARPKAMVVVTARFVPGRRAVQTWVSWVGGAAMSPRVLGGDVKRGKLIVVVGVDGSGKSTQLKRIAAALRARGIDILETGEPTKGLWGRKIREMARTTDRVPRETELAWFLKDRREHMRDTVGPALAAGRVVLCDRSYFSTVAYQGARGFDPAKLLAESQAEFGRPDLVLFFDIDAETGLARVAARGGTHEPAFEELNYLEQVAENFRALEVEEMVRIDASRDEDAVAQDVTTAVDRVVGE